MRIFLHLYLKKRESRIECSAIRQTILFLPGNMLFGLGGTQELSLPMMTVLRRFSILMTMGAEFYILGYRPKTSVQLSVYMMIVGAVVASLNDLAFNLKVSLSEIQSNLVSWIAFFFSLSQRNHLFLKKTAEFNRILTTEQRNIFPATTCFPKVRFL